MAKTLHIPLTQKWFDMTISGKKKEDYRDLKPYWLKRLMEIDPPHQDFPDEHKWWAENIIYDIEENGMSLEEAMRSYRAYFKSFESVTLSRAYRTTTSMPFGGVEYREGKPEWGAEPGKKYLVIKYDQIS